MKLLSTQIEPIRKNLSISDAGRQSMAGGIYWHTQHLTQVAKQNQLPLILNDLIDIAKKKNINKNHKTPPHNVR